MSPAPASNELRFARISADDKPAIEEVVRLNEEAFFPFESVCVGSELCKSPQAIRELSDLIRTALEDGVSVGAYRGDSLMGAAVNKIQTLPPEGEQCFFERFRNKRVHDPRARFLMDFMIDVDAKADLFAHLGTTSIMEIMFLCVHPDARGKGVARGLVSHSLDVARELEPKPRGASAIFTSDVSRAVGKRLGFEELAIAEHSAYVFEGKTMAQRLDSWQQRSVLVAFKL